MQYTTEYKSKQYYVGAVFKSNKYGDVIVIGKCNKDNYYVIKFINTGTIIEATTHAIRSGEIKDYYAHNIYGIGYYGDINVRSDKRTYQLWYGMLTRCYSEEYHKLYPTYKNVTVCDRWHCFTNFVDDIKNLKGYNEWINNDSYVLDKDMLNKDKEHKVYSPETCMFITETLNTELANLSRQDRVIIATRVSDGKVVEFTNKEKFVREHTDLKSASNMVSCLNGTQKTLGGWKFAYKD